MSKYTTEVRYICETNAGLLESIGYSDIEDVLNKAAPKIFDFSFPMFDENYRLVLEKKILKHYYTREICEETVGLWKLRLNDKMNVIMPYYNLLYNSALKDFNPFYDVDLSTTHKKTGKTDSKTTTNGSFEKNDKLHTENSNKYGNKNENTSWDLYSDTPQGGVAGINAATDPSLGTNAYLTNARKNTDNGGNSGTSSGDSDSTNKYDGSVTNKTVDDIKNSEEYVQRIVGKSGGESYSKLLIEFRKTFLNIDEMIIEELSDLFFGLWE